MKKDLKILLSQNNTKEVIQKLLSLTEIVNDNDELFDEVVLVSARYENYLKNKREDTVGFSEQQIQINKINSSLLQIIQKLPDSIEIKDSNIPIVNNNRIVEINIDQEFASFDNTKKTELINYIINLLNIKREGIIIRAIQSGSIKILLELPKSKALGLILKFDHRKEGLLGRLIFNITSIKLIGEMPKKYLLIKYLIKNWYAFAFLLIISFFIVRILSFFDSDEIVVVVVAKDGVEFHPRMVALTLSDHIARFPERKSEQFIFSINSKYKDQKIIVILQTQEGDVFSKDVTIQSDTTIVQMTEMDRNNIRNK